MSAKGAPLATSPRRRAQGQLDHVNPLKQRQALLKELSEVLQRTPRAYQSAGFSAIAQAVRMVEGGDDVERSTKDLEQCCDEMDAVMKRVAAAYEAGFTSALSAYGVIFEQVGPAREQLRRVGKKLRAVAQGVAPRTQELAALYLQLETTECIIELLGRVEGLAKVCVCVCCFFLLFFFFLSHTLSSLRCLKLLLNKWNQGIGCQLLVVLCRRWKIYLVMICLELELWNLFENECWI